MVSHVASGLILLKPWPDFYIEPEATDLLCILFRSRDTQTKLKSAKENLERLPNGMHILSDAVPLPQSLQRIEEAIVLAKGSESQAHDSLRVNFGYDSKTFPEKDFAFWFRTYHMPAEGILNAISMESQSHGLEK